MQRIKKQKREDRIDVGWLRQTENELQFRKFVEEQKITGENTWVDMKQRLTKAANDCIPKKKRNKKNNWMTDEIFELMNQRRNEKDQRAVKELTKTYAEIAAKQKMKKSNKTAERLKTLRIETRL